MGRRGRSNRDDNEDDSLEREWLRKRQRIVTESTDTDRNDDVARQDKDPIVINKTTGSLNRLSSDKEITDDKIERMRLKKQRKTERRKEKKATAATAEELRKDSVIREAAERKLQNLEKKQVKKQTVEQWIHLKKGVRRMDVTVGNGPFVRDRKTCRVSYVLRANNPTTGKILDSSGNFAFRPGKGEVIQGWDIGMDGMRVGGVRRLIVPRGAGYGNKDIGAGKGADLYFEVELLHVAP